MEWISFKDRKPKDGEFVLAYGDYCQGCTDGPKMAVWLWSPGYWMDVNMDCEHAPGDPTHWMPLPNPPKD